MDGQQEDGQEHGPRRVEGSVCSKFSPYSSPTPSSDLRPQAEKLVSLSTVLTSVSTFVPTGRKHLHRLQDVHVVRPCDLPDRARVWPLSCVGAVAGHGGRYHGSNRYVASFLSGAEPRWREKNHAWVTRRSFLRAVLRTRHLFRLLPGFVHPLG